MKVKTILVLIIVILSSIIFLQHRIINEEPFVHQEKLTFIDTIPYYVNVPKDSIVIRTQTRIIPINKKEVSLIDSDTEIKVVQDSSRDSVAVHIPITQKEYITEDYRAYVSGYSPSLDSIYIYRHNEHISRVSVDRKKDKKWCIGVSAGLGATRAGMQPYIGISITRSLFSF